GYSRKFSLETQPSRVGLAPVMNWRHPGQLSGITLPGTASVLFALDVILAAPAWGAILFRLEPGTAHGRPGFVVAAVVAFWCWVVGLYALGLYRRDAMLALRQSMGR